jgi:hypothetical protein
MNSKSLSAFTLVLFLAVALMATACGTLEIDTEPTAALIDAEAIAPAETPAAAPTQIAQPTPAELVEETGPAADAPVASAETGEAAAEPQAEIQRYDNTGYGFSLNYPSGWSLSEVNDADFAGPGSRSIQLNQGTVKLIIGYRRAGEQTPIGGSGAPAGDFESRGTIQVAGQDVEREVIVYEGKDKAVMYGQPGTPIAAGGLEFALRLDDFAQVDYGAIELSQEIQAGADFIASSLAIIEVEGAGDSETTAAADYDYAGWQSYSNETVGYMLMIPDQVDVMGANRDAAVEFVGPIVGDDHWPWFTVQHFDSEFFRPPAGTDVRQWIADSDSPYKDGAQETTIGGLPAVRLQIAASQQAYGMDEYYVIAGEQLYKITILHTGGLQDWDLYEQFLASITFSAGSA